MTTMTSNGPSSWIPSVQTIGLIMFTFWAVKSFLLYWFTDAETVHRGFYEGVMEPFNVQDKDGPGEWFLKNIIEPYFDAKKTVMRSHVLFSMIIALSLLIQLTPVIRRRYIKLHRLTGKVFLLLFSVQALPLLYYTWHVKIGWVMVWVELPLVPCGMYFGYRGYQQIKAGDVAGHRASMIMMTPTFFFFGFSRLLCPVFELAVVKLGKTLGGPLDIDLTALAGAEYIRVVFGSAGIIALWICYSVAVYNAYIAVPPQYTTDRKITTMTTTTTKAKNVAPGATAPAN